MKPSEWSYPRGADYSDEEKALAPISYLVVIPVLLREYAETCIASILQTRSAAGFEADELLLVDNSRDGRAADGFGLRVHRDSAGHNLGVARSWNVGAREVLERGIDWLVIISASMVFGPDMCGSFALRIRRAAGGMNMPDGESAVVVEAIGHGWHLMAIHRSVFALIGLFDENFYPAYEEDVDFSRRLILARIRSDDDAFSRGRRWAKVWVNAMSRGHGLHSHEVSVNSQALRAYYREKWGGEKGRETYATPFNHDPPEGLDHWPVRGIPDIAREHGLAVWW